MKNVEIVYQEIIGQKIMTKKQLDSYIEEKGRLPEYYTYKQWQKRGYQVKQGEKAKLNIKLWYQDTIEIETENGKEEVPEYKYVFMNLFSKKQVKKVSN